MKESTGFDDGWQDAIVIRKCWSPAMRISAVLFVCILIVDEFEQAWQIPRSGVDRVGGLAFLWGFCLFIYGAVLDGNDADWKVWAVFLTGIAFMLGMIVWLLPPLAT